MISNLSIMWRNVVKTIDIRRFEKNHKKKSNFQSSELRSRSKKWEGGDFFLNLGGDNRVTGD